MKKIYLTFMCLSFCWSFVPSALAKNLFVNRDNTKIYAEKSLKSPVVITLKTGDEVVMAENETGLFRKIKTNNGKEGYVPYTYLAEKLDPATAKIANMVRNLTKPQTDDAGDARTRSMNAVMGIRGLVATEKEALNVVSNSKPDSKAVFKLEEQIISKKAILNFSDEITKELLENQDNK